MTSGLHMHTGSPCQDITFFPGHAMKMQRLDLIDSWAGGNKLYKLKEYISFAKSNNINTLVSKGGMFSNHLDAFVSACVSFGLDCKCIIRSYKPDEQNPSLKLWKNQGADLFYLEPQSYDTFDAHTCAELFPDALFIPEGGSGMPGINGAATMVHDLDLEDVTHVIVAGGSMTTALGLMSALPADITLIIVPAWKNCTEVYLNDLIEKYQVQKKCRVELWNEYHFVGFAKFTSGLIDFMYHFTEKTNIPLDPVYNGKMMFGVQDKINQGYFDASHHVLTIHTGGMQGLEGFVYRDPEKWNSYAELIRRIS